MKTVYLHIGTHKTGTTSLQHFFWRAAGTLARQGVLYPRTGRSARSLWSHHELSWSFHRRQAAPPERLWKALQEEIEASPADRILLSSEHFSLLGPSYLRQLAAHLKGYRLEVLLYLRAPKDFLQSLYGQYLRSRGHRTFERFLQSAWSRCNYMRLVRRWERLDGVAALHLRPFDRVKRTPGLEADAAACLGLDFTPLAPLVLPPINTTPPREVLRLVRGVSRWEKRLVYGAGLPARPVGGVARRMRKMLYRKGPVLASIRATAGRDASWFEEVPAPVRDTFLMRLQDSHKIFLDRYIDPEDHRFLRL
ncbi:hypothetical protein GQ464_004135 [Rhodocaloribacter litoris]|uniref:hypothetical protein n=1 Tax=Rhodocaloribacter litoris TaxID=2558931 RepID=UPI0014229EFE|nr:hypothetical protein [Rhodocaloribacter litoris]QXD16148.1 hypothetical protein GQ464_004135 [Rhodocaloribacter litoris]